MHVHIHNTITHALGGRQRLSNLSVSTSLFFIILIHMHTSGGKQRWRDQSQTGVFAPACPPRLKGQK